MSRSDSAPPPVAGSVVAGAILGPWLMTTIADWDHVRRYNTEAENWTAFITVPFGLLFGALLGWLLAVWAGQFNDRNSRRGDWLPLQGRWLCYLLCPIIFVLSVAALYALTAMLVYDQHQPFNTICTVLLVVWAALLAAGILWTIWLSRRA
ncbi:MAG TPA: hypothetical protein VK689_09785 [Armatimonadota bacterium]|nr:hypothetical protein [Armatimonadota bacterium]